MKPTRRHFSGGEKVGILRRHLIDSVPISDLCTEHDLQPTVFYRWQKQFFENGAAAFDGHTDRPKETGDTARVRDLEAKLLRKHETLSEVMEEYVQQKNRYGASRQGKMRRREALPASHGRYPPREKGKREKGQRATGSPNETRTGTRC
jgi:transposase-like protein